MNWFKNIQKKMNKTASKADAKARALQQLQQGFDPFEVATDFTEEMNRIDPYFSYSDHGRSVSNSAGDSDSLIQAINSIPNDNAPVISPTITQQQQFNFQQKEPIDATFEEPKNEDIEINKDTVVEDNATEDATIDSGDDSEEDAVVAEETIKEENALSLTNIPQTEEEEDEEAYRNATEKIGNLYVKNPMTDKDFSIPTDNIPRLMAGIKRLNAAKAKMNQAPMQINWLDGVDEAGKPKSFIKMIKAKDGKTELAIDFVKFSIEGDLPNPLAASKKKIRDPHTRKVVDEKPVIYQVIGYLNADCIKGYEAREEKFNTYEEAAAFAARSNAALPEKDQLWVAKNTPKKYPPTDIANKDKVFYPAIYTGHWRSLVESYTNIPLEEGIKARFDGQVKDKFLNSGPRCDHCGTEKRGLIARKNLYVAIEYPEEQLPMVDDGKGNQVRQEPTEEQMKNGAQVQVGTKCISGHMDALKFIKNLERLKRASKEMGQKGGRKSDAFGGTPGAAKSLHQVFASYLMGRKAKGWYSRMLLDRIKSYYFGELRKKINKEEKMMPEPWGDPDSATVQEANNILDWWKSKDGQPGYDSTGHYGNLIGLALVDKIRKGQLKYLQLLKDSYAYLKRHEDYQAENKSNIYNNLGRMSTENESTNTVNDPSANTVAEPVAANPEPVNRAVVMKDIKEGERFTGKFKYSHSNKFFGGAYHILKDPTGQKISIKDIYKNGKPNFKFELRNEPYEISGIKGVTDRKYATIAIENAKIVGNDVTEEVVTERNTETTPTAQATETTQRTVQGGTALQEKLHDVNRQPIYYFTGDSFTYNNKDELKRMGFGWWGGGKMWWIFKRDLPMSKIRRLADIGFDTSIVNEQVQ